MEFSVLLCCLGWRGEAVNVSHFRKGESSDSGRLEARFKAQRYIGLK